MQALSAIASTYEPAKGQIGKLHQQRFEAFVKLQEVGRSL
jgi:hypothetical protein